MTSTTRYGALPADLGHIPLDPVEMMCWLYCPISLPGSTSIILPGNLKQFAEIVVEARNDSPYRFKAGYVYLTAKTLYVSGTFIGNRPGWHSDGFGTNDVNYIWCDRAPTEFLHLDHLALLSTDCDESMREMEALVHLRNSYGSKIVTFPDKHLLRLDPSVIHRSPVGFTAGMRTFVKVSVSDDRYDLIGNSINHDLPASHWPQVKRKMERNHPASVRDTSTLA